VPSVSPSERVIAAQGFSERHPQHTITQHTYRERERERERRGEERRERERRVRIVHKVGRH